LPKTKPDTTAAVAAHQAVWHAKQAASYWNESDRRTLSARGRETARKRFLEHTRLALHRGGLVRVYTEPAFDALAIGTKRAFVSVVYAYYFEGRPSGGTVIVHDGRSGK
jgi:hypothetical protein